MSDEDTIHDTMDPSEILADLGPKDIDWSGDGTLTSDHTSIPISHPDFTEAGLDDLSGMSSAIDSESVSDTRVEPDMVEAFYNFATEASRAGTPFSVTFDTIGDVIVDDPDLTELADVEPERVTAKQETVSALLSRIGDAIHEREKDGYSVETLILGQPQYSAIHAFSSDEYNVPPEMLFPVELIVVPGPQIHPVVANDQVLSEYLADD